MRHWLARRSRTPLCTVDAEGRDRPRRRAGSSSRGSERRGDRRSARRSPAAFVALARGGAGRRSAEHSAQARLRPCARALEMNRHAAEKRGRGAETLACWYLRLTGWRILARRARVPGGEVDVIARRGRTLAFVEVKQ